MNWERELCTLLSSESATLDSKESLYSIGGQQTAFNDRHDAMQPDTVSRQSRFKAKIHVLLSTLDLLKISVPIHHPVHPDIKCRLCIFLSRSPV